MFSGEHLSREKSLACLTKVSVTDRVMGISKNPGRTKHGREGGVPPDPSIDIHAYTHTNRLNALLPDHSHTHCYMYIFRWSMAAVCKLLRLYIGVLVLNIQIHHKHHTKQKKYNRGASYLHILCISSCQFHYTFEVR